MITIIALWTLVILNCLHFGAHLYDSVSGIPNWKSGEIKEVKTYRDFHHKGKKAYFFAPVIFASIIVSIISLFLILNNNEITKLLVILCIIINISTLISVIILFKPINEYMEKTDIYDPIKLKALVGKWYIMDKIRLVITLLNLIFSIWALNSIGL